MPRRMDSSLHGVACAVAQAVGVLPLALFPCFAMADNYYNPAFLSNDPSAVADLSRFEKNSSQAPGKYLVDLYLNDVLISTENINFVASTSDKSKIIPCLTSKRLGDMGVNLKAVPDLEKLPADACVSLTDSFPRCARRL